MGSGQGSDADLERKIREALDADPGLRSYAIDVAIKGGDVHLSGVVDVLSEKERAENLAREVAGGREIENGLTVCTDGAVDDEDVEFEIAEEFAHDPRIDPKQVGVEVAKGVAHLVGRVDTLEEAEVAKSVAAKARGVVGVKSKLKFTDYGDADDSTLSNRIQDALLNSREVRAANVRAYVRNGEAHLVGSVPDQSDRDAALEVAKGVGGVRQVVDELEVEDIIRI